WSGDPEVSSRQWWDDAQVVAGIMPVRHRSVTTAEWQQSASELAEAGDRLLALWAADGVSSPALAPGASSASLVRAAIAIDAGVLVLELSVDGQAEGGTGTPAYPGL